ncbi:MAG: LytR C-terminal domain-containing protein [Candidatus Kapabacteria bacterium]|nr:LytR C-terminal domain-containing protein [Candidatus Kapabacteria bacterium]
MIGDSGRPIWAWALIAILGVVVLAFIGSLVWRFANPPVSALVNEDDPRSTIQVEVVNASGRQGAGRHTLEFLRERGFDVVEISTSLDRPRKSTIVDRMGDKVSSRKLSASMGIPDSLIITEIDSLRFVRATIVLGADVDNLVPFHD